MGFFDWALLGAGGLYAGAVLWLIRGLGRQGPPSVSGRPSASVVVAARNEEGQIDRCLQALRAQDYEGEWEVIVVDDRSADGTAARVEAMAENWSQVRLVRAPGIPRFRCPKKSALALGIEASSGELLLFTDADCRPPPGWVRSTVACFAENVGLVAGYSYPEPGRRWRQQCLALDNLAVGALSAGSFAMGRPLSCTGRNLAYRRAVYEQVGGFECIGHLVGGDDVYFMRLVAGETTWKLVYNRRAEAAVACAPPPEAWGAICQQKLRHAAKAGNYRGGALLLGVGVYLFHLLLALGLAGGGALAWGVWAGRWALDGALLWRMARSEERRLLAFLPLVEVVYIPYVLFFAGMGRMGWFRWKE